MGWPGIGASAAWAETQSRRLRPLVKSLRVRLCLSSAAGFIMPSGWMWINDAGHVAALRELKICTAGRSWQPG